MFRGIVGSLLSWHQRVTMVLAFVVVGWSQLGSLAAQELEKVELGHCNLVQNTRFAGSYRACWWPTSYQQCEALGAKAGFRDAVFESGECDASVAVGFCTKGLTKIYYFDGDPSELAIGCTYQRGSWE